MITIGLVAYMDFHLLQPWSWNIGRQAFKLLFVSHVVDKFSSTNSGNPAELGQTIALVPLGRLHERHLNLGLSGVQIQQALIRRRSASAIPRMHRVRFMSPPFASSSPLHASTASARVNDWRAKDRLKP